MKNPSRAKNYRIAIFCLIAIALSLSGWVVKNKVGAANSVSAFLLWQDGPYTLNSLMTGIADANKAGLEQDFLVEAVQKRGVDFRFTQEALQQLRQAGANNKLLIAIRDNCRGPQCDGTPPPPTPTPKPTALQAGTEVQTFANLRMVWIPPGRFRMGSDNVGGAAAKPAHEVEITKGFFLGKFEVTQAQWRAVALLPRVRIDLNPDPMTKFVGDTLPVTNISWEEAKEFIARLNARRDGNQYRLPTEAEWEYACRAGQNGDDFGNLNDFAWYANNSGKQVIDFDEILRTDRANAAKRLEENGAQLHPVGKKKGNAWGLYDMLGNASEWCEDWYQADFYSSSPLQNPSGPPQGTAKLARGGSFDRVVAAIHPAVRATSKLDDRSVHRGFRIFAVGVGNTVSQNNAPAAAVLQQIGCLKDAEARDLSGPSWISEKMTISACGTFCRERGMTFAGVQYGSQCYCGNSYGKYGGAANCNMPCSGNKDQNCGGEWANNVYKVK